MDKHTQLLTNLILGAMSRIDLKGVSTKARSSTGYAFKVIGSRKCLFGVLVTGCLLICYSVGVSQDGTATQVIPSPDLAKSVGERVVSSLDGLTNRVQQNYADIRKHEQKIRECKLELARLERDRSSALWDLRGGFFCSECGRTKTEIEKTGEDFYSHLRSVNGHAIPASQERIDAKMKEFDDRIKPLQQQQQQSAEIVEVKKRENTEAMSQIQEGINLWVTAAAIEQNLIGAQYEADKRKYQADIKSANDKSAQVEDARSKALARGPVEKTVLDSLEAAKTLYAITRSRLENESGLRDRIYWNDLREARERQVNEFSRISEFTKRTLDSDKYLNPYRIGTPFSVSFAGLNIYTTPDQVGAKYKFGVLGSGGIAAVTTTTSSELDAFFNVFYMYKVGVAWKTIYTPEGVISGASPDVTASSSPDLKISIGSPIIEEKEKNPVTDTLKKVKDWTTAPLPPPQ